MGEKNSEQPIDPDNALAKRTEGGELEKVRETAQEIFQETLENLKEVGKLDMVGGQEFDVDAQLLATFAHHLEKAGDNTRALEVYERALDAFVSGRINTHDLSGHVYHVMDVVSGIARTGGEKREALNKLFTFCRRLIAPEVIADIGEREYRSIKGFVREQGFALPDLPETLAEIIDLLPDLPSSPRKVTDTIRGRAGEAITMIRLGIEHAGERVTQGLSHAAVLAHGLESNVEAEQFLEQAHLIAQIQSMSMKAVMSGNLSAPKDRSYDNRSAMAIAHALGGMKRILEATEFALQYTYGHESDNFLSDTIPELLKSNPKDPRILDFVSKFLKHSDFGKSETTVANARMQIALILQSQYGFVEPKGMKRLTDEGSEKKDK